MDKFVRAEDVKDLLNGLDSLPWEDEVEYMVDRLPKAHVQEVVSAKWIRKEKAYFYWYECSNCECRPPKNIWNEEYYSSYCPDCGAKMECFTEEYEY